MVLRICEKVKGYGLGKPKCAMDGFNPQGSAAFQGETKVCQEFGFACKGFKK